MCPQLLAVRPPGLFLVLLLAVPATPQEDSLASAAGQMWQLADRLHESGLLRNEGVALFPLLFDGQATGSSEDLARRIAQEAPEWARLIEGDRLRGALEKVGIGTAEYRDTARLDEFGQRLGVGLVVGGTFREKTRSGPSPYLVKVEATRPGRRYLDFGRMLEIPRSHELRNGNNVESSTPFGLDARATEVRLRAADELDMLLDGAVAELTSKLDGSTLDRIGVLPAVSTSGELTSLGDELVTRLVTGLHGSKWPALLERRMREDGATLAWFLGDDLDPVRAERLGLKGTVLPRIDFLPLTRQLVVKLTYSDRDGRWAHVSREYAVSDSAALLLGRWAEKPSSLAFGEDIEVDAEYELHRAIMLLVGELMSDCGAVEDARVRFLPLRTPATGDVSALFSKLAGQLLDARDEVMEAAGGERVLFQKALGSTRFPVELPLIEDVEFSCWEDARRQVMEHFFVRAYLSPAFQSGRDLMESVQDEYTLRIQDCGGTLQRTDVENRRLERVLESRSAAEASAGPEKLRIPLPDRVVGIRCLTIGDRVHLVGELSALDPEDTFRSLLADTWLTGTIGERVAEHLRDAPDLPIHVFETPTGDDPSAPPKQIVLASSVAKAQPFTIVLVADGELADRQAREIQAALQGWANPVFDVGFTDWPALNAELTSSFTLSGHEETAGEVLDYLSGISSHLPPQTRTSLLARSRRIIPDPPQPLVSADGPRVDLFLILRD